MSILRTDAVQRVDYWPVPIARAIPAAVLAIVITFSPDHSARIGITGFGLFALTSGAIVTIMTARRFGASGVRPYLIAAGLISVVLGAVAIPLSGGGLPTLLLLVTVWATLTGALELYSGIRTRRRHVASADWITVGAITLLASIAFVLIPPDLADEFTNADGSTGLLDSSIVAVGLLGAYAAIIVVFLLIAGLSAKWGTRAEPAAPATGTGDPA